MKGFVPSRLTVARQWRSLTMKGLAERLMVTPGAVTHFESGIASPSEDTVALIAKELKFPGRFFFEEKVEPIDPDAVSFRARSSMTARVRDRAQCALWFGAEKISPWLSMRFNLPETDVPDMARTDPQAAADDIRRHWQLGRGPINNVVHLLEAKGVDVYWLNEASPCVDGLSFWRDGRPFVALNSAKGAGDRSRLDAAHELGHLLLHRWDTPVGTPEQERAAYKFAAAFLMPGDAFGAEAPRFIDFGRYLRLKSRWGVSIAAAIVRSRDLGILTDWQYQSGFKEISRNGWRKTEPGGLSRETSALHPMVMSRLRRQGIGLFDFCGALALDPSTVCEIMPDMCEATAGLDTVAPLNVTRAHRLSEFDRNQQN